jgi:hypothetical protein
MAERLFILPEDMTSSTILSGNTDTDKYLFCILQAQITTIEPLLGSELYDKIKTDLGNLPGAGNLTGLYLELYTDFIKPITKNEALAQYIEIASYMVDNAGIYKRSGENVEVVDKDEVQYLSGKYKSLAQMYVTRFEKWICKNPLIEYKTIQDEVNALKNINLNVGWKL